MTQARLASSQFVFAPASKTITFSGVPGFIPEGVVDVFHVPSGLTLYSPYKPAAGGTFAGNVLTLATDTTATYGASKSYAPGDVLLITYNDMARDDELRVYAPRATGPLETIACRSFQSLVLDVQSSTAISGQVEGSIDGTQWKAIKGQLPNLDSNPGDDNWNEGKPFNMRQYDITPYRLVRVNPTGYSTGTPTINVLLKTVPAPVRKVIVNGGSVIANFDSGGSVGYVRTTALSPEVFRGVLQSGAAVSSGGLTGGVLAAGAVITGGSRQAPGQPNPYFSRFGVTIDSDQSGTLEIQASTDGTNWIRVATQAVVANTPFDLEVKVRAHFYRAVYTQGSTASAANKFSMLTSYCGA